MQRAVSSPLCAQPLLTGRAFLPCYQLCYLPLDVFKGLSILFTFQIAAQHTVLKVRLHLAHRIFLWTRLKILISKHYNNGNRWLWFILDVGYFTPYKMHNFFFFFPEKSFSAVWNTDRVSIYLLACQYLILGMEWAMRSENKQHICQCCSKKAK